MKVNNEKVLNAIERIVGQIPPELLYHFRYKYSNCKISGENLKQISASLHDFITSGTASNTNVYTTNEKKLSLYCPCIYLESSTKRCRIKVYSPETIIKTFTTQIRIFKPLEVFKDELLFFQNGKIVSFEELIKEIDIIAISRKEINGKSIVIHYVP